MQNVIYVFEIDWIHNMIHLRVIIVEAFKEHG